MRWTILALALAAGAAGAAPDRSALPSPRPALAPQAAEAPPPAPRVASVEASRPARHGGLCGRPSIGGERIAPVTGPGACGIPDAVRVTHVSGLALSRPARMDCETARALDDWAREGVLPVVGRAGGGAVGLYVAAGYACRARNHRAGARLSEHSFGRAIDISGIRLANGNTVSVLAGWRSSAHGAMLRELHARACGIFGTVLGPGSDGHHEDHLHLDTARHRSGSYCR